MPEPISNALDIMVDALAQFIASLPAIVTALIIFFIAYRIANPVSKMIGSGKSKSFSKSAIDCCSAYPMECYHSWFVTRLDDRLAEFFTC